VLFVPVLGTISDRFTLLAQYALNYFRRRPPIRDGTSTKDWELRAKATHGLDGRSEHNGIDFAGTDSVGAHETRFGARVQNASRQVARLQNLAGPANGFHLGVTDNIVLRSDSFDSLSDHGAVPHKHRANRNFPVLASNLSQP
jgi:hypothetical protein